MSRLGRGDFQNTYEGKISFQEISNTKDSKPQTLFMLRGSDRVHRRNENAPTLRLGLRIEWDDRNPFRGSRVHLRREHDPINERRHETKWLQAAPNDRH